MEGHSLTAYKDTDWDARWSTVEQTGAGSREAFVVRASMGGQVSTNCHKLTHNIARGIIEDWATWPRA